MASALTGALSHEAGRRLQGLESQLAWVASDLDKPGCWWLLGRGRWSGTVNHGPWRGIMWVLLGQSWRSARAAGTKLSDGRGTQPAVEDAVAAEVQDQPAGAAALGTGRKKPGHGCWCQYCLCATDLSLERRETDGLHPSRVWLPSQSPEWPVAGPSSLFPVPSMEAAGQAMFCHVEDLQWEASSRDEED